MTHSRRPWLLRRRRPWLLRLVAAATFAPVLLLAAGGLWLRAEPLLRVELPAPEQAVGLGGVEVLIQFPASGRAQAATFRALLNGADVTTELERAENGVHGHLHGLLDGENRLQLEVFGRAPWAFCTLVEESRELRVFFRRAVTHDRA